MKNNNKKGFTLAEVLITLTIIGVIAAILFPSILANYTERTLKAKRSAFVARMSQAMAELTDQFGSFENVTCQDANKKNTCTDSDTAIKFLNEGLSKVYKLSAVCDRDSFDACDIPNIITKQDGTTVSLYDLGTSFKTWVDGAARFGGEGNGSGILYKDLYSAGFMTKNGESGIVFVNPACSAKSASSMAQEIFVCANMIFDLNGAKGKPNKFGEDIWFLSVLYPDSPTVAAPKVYNFNDAFYTDGTDSSGNPAKVSMINNNGNGINYAQASDICSSRGDNVTLPSYEEATSISLNLRLLTDTEFFRNNGSQSTVSTETMMVLFWTSTPCNTNAYWAIEVDQYPTRDNDPQCKGIGDAKYNAPLCVYDD